CIGKSGAAARKNLPRGSDKQYGDSKCQRHIEVELLLAEAMPCRGKVIPTAIQQDRKREGEIHPSKECRVLRLKGCHAEIFGKAQHHGVAKTEPSNGNLGDQSALRKLSARLYHIL